LTGFFARAIANFIIFYFIPLHALRENLANNKVDYDEQELTGLLKEFTERKIISFDGNVIADVNRERLIEILKIPVPF